MKHIYKREDLVVGKCYVYTYENRTYIIKIKRVPGVSANVECIYLCAKYEEFGTNGGFALRRMANGAVVEADNEEIRWLSACIDQNRYIPLGEALEMTPSVDNLEIF